MNKFGQVRPIFMCCVIITILIHNVFVSILTYRICFVHCRIVTETESLTARTSSVSIVLEDTDVAEDLNPNTKMLSTRVSKLLVDAF